jgi:hypothetical protein
MGNNESSKDILLAILCFEAKRWVGSVEEGRNGGQLGNRPIDDVLMFIV